MPQNEFKLETWIDLPGPLDFNKAVMYLIIAGILTCGTMIWIAGKMQQRPNRVQTAVEALFSLMRDNITYGNLDNTMAKKWFPFIGTIFLFIWFNNLIGYIPLPTNTEHTFELLGFDIPSFAIYAATANLSVPLTLALIVFVSYTVEGVRAKGAGGYLKSLIPAGVTGAMAAFIFVLEFLSNFMRLISLSVRLFANILAGHLIILFMSGGLAVLLGRRGARHRHAADRRRPVHLRGRPGRNASGVHLRHADCHLPRRRRRRASLTQRSTSVDLLFSVVTLLAQAGAENGADAGKAIALGVGGGLGAVGAGVGIGIIFGKVIESVTRQPEMRDEITGIQWLGFALTEACFFYGLVAGLIAFFL